MKEELPWCGILEDGEYIPTCMMLVYRDYGYLLQEEYTANGWCQVTITCVCCGSSETWVEEE